MTCRNDSARAIAPGIYALLIITRVIQANVETLISYGSISISTLYGSISFSIPISISFSIPISIPISIPKYLHNSSILFK